MKTKSFKVIAINNESSKVVWSCVDSFDGIGDAVKTAALNCPAWLEPRDLAIKVVEVDGGGRGGWYRISNNFNIRKA